MNEIQTVTLNDEERALAEGICWDLDELMRKDRDAREAALEKMGQLAEHFSPATPYQASGCDTSPTPT